jgi:hypothetical protein
MKPSTLALSGIVAANAVFVGAMVFSSPADSDSMAPHSKSITGDLSTTPPIKTWAELQSDSLGGQRDRMSAAGFPPDIVRAILRAQVNESFAPRRKALEEARSEIPFWKDSYGDPKLQAASLELYREQEKILKDLLGRDGRRENAAQVAILHRRFGNLSDEKVDQIVAIADDYQQRRSTIYENSRGALSPADQQKLVALDQEMRTDFASVLTPAELADYELRSSNTAYNLRASLAKLFDPSEQEYRALFQLQKSFDDQFGSIYGIESPAQMKARADAQKQLTDDIKATLGADRYADYQRATDGNYRQTCQLVARLELSPEAANQVYATQKDIVERTDAIRADRSLGTNDRTVRLAALATEAQTKLVGAIGQRGYTAYRQNNLGRWLENLTPPVASPPSK